MIRPKVHNFGIFFRFEVSHSCGHPFPLPSRRGHGMARSNVSALRWPLRYIRRGEGSTPSARRAAGFVRSLEKTNSVLWNQNLLRDCSQANSCCVRFSSLRGWWDLLWAAFFYFFFFPLALRPGDKNSCLSASYILTYLLVFLFEKLNGAAFGGRSEVTSQHYFKGTSAVEHPIHWRL